MAKTAKPRAAQTASEVSKAKRAAKPAAAKAKPSPPPAAAKAAVASKPTSRQADKTVKVTQIRSPAGRYAYQRATLRGLGLDKMNRSRVLEDTPAVRGMIERVKHLIRVEPVA